MAVGSLAGAADALGVAGGGVGGVGGDLFTGVGFGAVAASTAPESALAALRAPNPRARPKRTESMTEV